MKHMSDGGAAAASFKAVKSGLSDAFRYLPSNPTHAALVADAAKAGAKRGRPSRHREPLTRGHIQKMAAICHTHKLSAVRDLFSILLAFRGFLRGGEVMALGERDVELRELERDESALAPAPALSAAAVASAAAAAAAPPPSDAVPRAVLVVYISSSNTNPQAQREPEFRCGETVIIGPDRDAAICPIAWYRRYLALRSADLKGQAATPPLFYSSRARAARDSGAFNETVKRWLSLIGVDPRLFGEHSARAGGATEAARLAVDLRLIKRQGRWKSDAVFIYIHDDTSSMLALQEALGGVSLS